MSLVVPGPRFSTFELDKLPFSVIRHLRRRSSCPSIPRSVSVCGSFDLSSENLHGPADFEVEYLSPLFRLGGIGESLDEAAKRVSAAPTTAPTEDFTPEEDANQCDDGLFERFSCFVVTDEEDAPPREQSPTTSAHNHPLPVVQSVPSNTDLSKPLPSRPSSPTLAHSLPPVPATVARPIVPPDTTRPLRIDRSKKRQETLSAPQRAPRADAQYERRPPRPILRSTTQVNLRDAYRRTGQLAERKVPAKLAVPTIPPSPKAHPKTPTPSATEQVPFVTLFPTALIPLEDAQDKFKHAHCLERLPSPPDPADPDHRSQPLRGWSFSRAFRKQKA
ncbi:hypothetical protein BC827DRAFT_1265441 [Russula dissimulans]|nr:hypothetical protein BC827DRAFT_1265441 [Russula dissimulans]